MKRALLLAAALAFSACHPHWQEVDRFMPTSLYGAEPHGMANSGKATLAVGEAPSPGGARAWTVRRTLDRGGSWETVDSALAGFEASRASGAAAGPDGTLYVAGMASEPGTLGEGPRHWIVRKSTDLGTTWATIHDLATYGNFVDLDGRGVAVAQDGTIYTIGIGRSLVPGGPRAAWFTRRSTDGGATWTGVDEVGTTDDDADVAPLAITVAPGGAVFVAGRYQPDRTTDASWVTRRSVGGTTWSTVDTYQMLPGRESWPLAAASAPDGTVLIVGGAIDNGSNSYWIVRRAKPSAPSSWTTIDTYTPGFIGFPAEPGNAQATGVTISPAGYAFVSGYTQEFEGTPSGVVERWSAVTRVALLSSGVFNNTDVRSIATNPRVGLQPTGATIGESGDIFNAMTITASSTGATPIWSTRRFSTLH